jgi:hypothetical protein
MKEIRGSHLGIAMLFNRLYPEKLFYIVCREDGQLSHADSSKGQGIVTFPNAVTAHLWMDFVARADGRKWTVKAASAGDFPVLLAEACVTSGFTFFFHARFSNGQWQKKRMEVKPLLDHLLNAPQEEACSENPLESLLFPLSRN